ncbi:MAG: Lrp/AsnC family transcriptional regulator [Deltaproteobacteria bacterium]
MCKIDTVEKILKKLPSDFPLTEDPYKEIAERVGISENELIEKLARLKSEGVIRRIAAILYHRRASYTHNAMVVWNTGAFDVEKTGEIMASFPEVSHCYERDRGGYWEYNLYTMIHGRSMEECNNIIRRISEKIGINDYRMFLSKREFKKIALTVNRE